MIELLSISPLSSIQDLGRHGYLRYGVGTSGAMDDVALAVGNLLLGNPENSAAIEVQMFPYEVRFLEDTVFALSGADAAAELDGVAVPSWWARWAKKDQVLILNPPEYGARTYLALAGGIDVPAVLGSRSTQLRGSFGGLQGRFLQPGDTLRAAASGGDPASFQNWPAAGFGVEPPAFALPLGDTGDVLAGTRTFVRVLPAAEYDCYEEASLASFWRQDWMIDLQSNRYGYRLNGEALIARRTLEQRSHGIVPGVIQVPPNGQPIIQLRDAQPSGGYPKIGTVIEADLWRLGQAQLCSAIRFLPTTYESAVTALKEVRSYLDKVRRLAAFHRRETV